MKNLQPLHNLQALRTLHIKKLAFRILLYTLIVAIGLCYYLYLLEHKTGFPCLFQTIFHVKCLSCGSTTAVMALLRGDFLTAIKANALFVLLVYPTLLFFILQDLYICIYRLFTNKNKFSLIEKLFNKK